MTAHYLDTSALIRFVLEGDVALGARIRRARRVFTSVLTVIEGERALQRAFARERVDHGKLRDARLRLRSHQQSMDVQHLSESIVARAQQIFPLEPVRTLDAIHLATAVEWNERVDNVVFITTDDHLRANAEALGMPTIP